MKIWWWIAGSGVALVALAVFMMMRTWRDDPEPWTTSSPRALEAYERGLDSLAKHYWADAAPHFERAVELDRDFAAAKLQLLLTDGGSAEDRERWFRDLGETNLARLTPRERFLIGYWRARFAGDSAEATALLESFVAEWPTDPWGLTSQCELSWEKETWDEAEACYRRLIDMHPNWVQAQNRLGLIAMARGRFPESEEHFRTYRYIAPDQAAPWDGLGQLLMTRGHYEKAEEALSKALEIKGDYCYALWHIAVLESIRRRFDASAEHLAALEGVPACGDYQAWGMICSRRAWNAYASGDLDEALHLMDEPCLEKRGGFDFVAHRLALASGDFAHARRLEEALESRLDQKRESGDVYVFYKNFLRATGKHLVATRLWAEAGLAGESPAEACRILEEADQELLYWGSDRAMFKLFNLRQLAACHDAAGNDQAAAQARADLDFVNPRYRAEYDLPELPGTAIGD